MKSMVPARANSRIRATLHPSHTLTARQTPQALHLPRPNPPDTTPSAPHDETRKLDILPVAGVEDFAVQVVQYSVREDSGRVGGGQTFVFGRVAGYPAREM